jgi:hypothetical protein
MDESILEPIVEPVTEESDKTTIPCKKPTRIRIKNEGKKGESYDHLMNRILDDNERMKKELTEKKV